MSLCNVIAEAQHPEYKSITVPLLILAGSDDQTSPMSGSEAIKNAYGTLEDQKSIEILKGVGHWHCVEAPEEVQHHATRFIQNL